MVQPDEIERLRREVRGLRVAVLSMAMIGFGLGAAAFTRETGTQSFEHITAERIDIVEPDGVRRLVLTSDARTPGPIIDGREGTRNFPFSGVMLYGPDGDEIGGYGSGRNAQGDIMMQTMDFGQSEALASFRRLDTEGRGSVGIFLNDQPPLDMPSREAVQQDWGRIKLQTPDRNAEILLTDTQRRPRIRLIVDAQDRARIEVLDVDGEVVGSVPDGLPDGSDRQP